MRPSLGGGRRDVPRLPLRPPGVVAVGVPLRGTGEAPPDAVEVLRHALERRSAGSVDARGDGSGAATRVVADVCRRSCRRGAELGSARTEAEARAGVRPSSGAQSGGAPADGMAGSKSAPASDRDASAGHAVGARPEAGVARSVPRGRPASVASHLGGRRPDHGRHRRRVRRGAPRCRCRRSGPPHGGPIARGAASGPLLYSGRTPAWVCGCPGEVLPVVDASRRQNDPRKTTVGRRAWCGLDVSPAPERSDPPGRRR